MSVPGGGEGTQGQPGAGDPQGQPGAVDQASLDRAIQERCSRPTIS
jgi:hypothetical protein